MAGRSVAPAGTGPRNEVRLDGSRSSVARRAVGEHVVGKAGQRGDARRAADDDEAAAGGDPATQRIELVGRELVAVDVLPDQPIECAPAFDALREVREGQRDDRGSRAGAVRRELDLGDQALGPLGQHADHELRGVVDKVGNRRAFDDLFARDEVDLDACGRRRAAGRGGRRSCVSRSRGRRPSRSARGSRSRRPCAAHPGSAARRSGGSTSMAAQEPARAWPWSMTRASIVSATGRRSRKGERPGQQRDDREQGERPVDSPRRTDRERQGRCGTRPPGGSPGSSLVAADGLNEPAAEPNDAARPPEVARPSLSERFPTRAVD